MFLREEYLEGLREVWAGPWPFLSMEEYGLLATSGSLPH